MTRKPLILNFHIEQINKYERIKNENNPIPAKNENLVKNGSSENSKKEDIPNETLLNSMWRNCCVIFVLVALLTLIK